MNRRRRPSKQSNYFISPQTVFVKVGVIKLNYKMINLSRRKKLTHPKVGGIKPAFLPSFRFILNSFLFLAIFFSFLSLSSPVLANEDLSAVALAKEEFFLTKIRTATFNCRPAGGNPAQRLAACLPRRVAERLLRGPLDKARKSGKILKQKGWWVGLER